MRADIIEVLRVVQLDYSVLDDVVWGRSTRSITSLLRIPTSDDETVVDLTDDCTVSSDDCTVSSQQLK